MKRKPHQTQEILDKMYRETKEEVRTNSVFVRDLVVLSRNMHKRFSETPKYSDKESLVPELLLIEGILAKFYPHNGWFCFYCGYLDPIDVTHDECCALCGADLPYLKERGFGE